MPAITDWDLAYSNRDHSPDWPSFIEKWTAAAAAWRARLAKEGRMKADVTYGDGERNKLDLFLPEDEPQGLAIFIHGGYWRSFDKSLWSHLAEGALANGFAVAMPSYTLCPQTTISGITREITAAIECAAGLVDGPIRLSGHSAGGHLVTRMICTDTTLSSATLARIGPVLSISGVHDLRPLIRTEMNADFKLTREEAAAESPALLTPLEDRKVTCWAGGAELPEFIRQNDLLANIWTGMGMDTEIVHEPGKHHFSVVDSLADRHSALTQKWLGL
ncbi:alpha/beta hydrolase [Pseudohoeflea suaedae]|uniref:Alpha/beta hydrolase n=1 Tax=Pseudohoeflea suaedae TaxID=877384 RepID=A0A4R5PMW2_9HYPH|nr:alpha/beta hydrolase [Pseudohoeflea suaedae]TDH38364.1 alpha/beta hydrolase [Pseudohoeflea suaedae]